MGTVTVFFLALSIWVLVGAIAGFSEARRGHWSWLWLLGAMAGPMVIPLTRQLRRDERAARPIELHHGSTRAPGGLRVLAGIDGSAASLAAARQAVDILGFRLGELVLGAVVDYEAQIDPSGDLAPPQSWDAEARDTLEMARSELGRWLGFEPTTVLLAGRPADALRLHAEQSGLDLVVIGCRGRGLTKRLLGSCASDMAKGSRVPVLLMPHPVAGDLDQPSEAVAGH